VRGGVELSHRTTLSSRRRRASSSVFSSVPVVSSDEKRGLGGYVSPGTAPRGCDPICRAMIPLPGRVGPGHEQDDRGGHGLGPGWIRKWYRFFGPAYGLRPDRCRARRPAHRPFHRIRRDIRPALLYKANFSSAARQRGWGRRRSTSGGAPLSSLASSWDMKLAMLADLGGGQGCWGRQRARPRAGRALPPERFDGHAARGHPPGLRVIGTRASRLLILMANNPVRLLRALTVGCGCSRGSALSSNNSHSVVMSR
jgi:hypothetical protein